jgi:hypothetical protein
MDTCKSGRHPQILVMVRRSGSRNVFLTEMFSNERATATKQGCLDDSPPEQNV